MGKPGRNNSDPAGRAPQRPSRSEQEAAAALQQAHRVIALLNRDQVDFLDKLGKDAQFSSGTKLSRTQILAAMVNAIKRLDLNGDGVKTTSQFEQRIIDAIQRRGAGP
jgi:hypothetical protein